MQYKHSVTIIQTMLEMDVENIIKEYKNRKKNKQKHYAV